MAGRSRLARVVAASIAGPDEQRTLARCPMRRTNPSLGVVACATVGLTALLFSGCTNEPMSDTASPSAQVGTVARVDVPAVTIDLPAEPRPWDNSDEALV